MQKSQPSLSSASCWAYFRPSSFSAFLYPLTCFPYFPLSSVYPASPFARGSLLPLPLPLPLPLSSLFSGYYCKKRENREIEALTSRWRGIGVIRFWGFDKLEVKSSIDIKSSITQMEYDKESNLLAVIADDLVIRIFDVETKRLVRKFKGHKNQITDCCFSHDSRWLISSGIDCTVRVCDIVSSKLIDWFSTRTPVTSLAFSPSGEFLATTQFGNLGIFLWSNKSYYSNVFLHPPPSSPPLLTLPINSFELDTEESSPGSYFLSSPTLFPLFPSTPCSLSPCHSLSSPLYHLPCF